MLKRYLIVVAIILAGVLVLGFWSKPPLDQLRKEVDEEIASYVAAHPELGATKPAEETGDWFVAVSHVAKLGDQTFSCWGAFKTTVCTAPK